MIYYFCYDNQSPTGGSVVTYRHVNLINRLGLSAAVVHQKSGFVLPGYVGELPPVIGSLDLVLQSSDILVLPGDLGPGLNHIAPGVRKIIFNQNVYHSFRGYGLGADELPPYLHPECIAVFVVSDDNKRYLEACFPGLSCTRLHISFDQEKYFCSNLDSKERAICFMTRKNGADVLQVVSALRSRGRLAGWKFVAIENRTPDEVAAIMKASAIYMSFGHPEGISLSNLEAMIAGCRVVGYSGMGCREYFGKGLCLEVPFGDIVSFVESVEMLALAFERCHGEYNRDVKRAQSYVRDTYSPERERKQLEEIYARFV